MKNLKFVLFVFVSVLLLVGCRRLEAARQEAPTPASQPAVSPGQNLINELNGEVLFHDDFQDGQSDGWKISAGWNVFQEGDVYVFGSVTAGAALVPQGIRWDNYIVRIASRVDSGSLGMNFLVSNEGRYILTYQQDGLILGKEQPRGNITQLIRSDAPSLGKWHWFTIAAEGGHILVMADRDLVINYTDSARLSSGTIALTAGDGSRLVVDNVSVVRLKGRLPSSGVAGVPITQGGNVLPPAPALPELPAPDQQVVVNPPPAQPVQISFTVEGRDRATVDAGSCVTTEWNVINALEVYYQNEAVQARSFRDECPTQDATYTLEVLPMDGRTSQSAVSVTVNRAPEPVNGGGGDDDGGGGSAPDIVVQNVTVPNTALQEPIPVRVSLHNAGQQLTGAFTVVWYPDRTNDIIGCSWDIVGIAPGQGIVEDCVYPGYPVPGTYEWRVVADVEREMNESDERNNTESGRILIRGQQNGGPDPNGSLIPPTNCRAANVTQQRVTISWRIPAGAQQEGFRIYQATTSREGEAAAQADQFTVGNLTPNVQYEFDVRAFAAGQETAPNACAITVTTSP